MAVKTRNQALTTFGHDVAVFTAGAVDFVSTFTNVGLTVEVDTLSARSVMDFDDCSLVRSKGFTLDMSKVTESTVPLMEQALIDADTGWPTYVMTLRHAPTGSQYSFTGLITSAKWNCTGDAVQTEDCTIVSLGPVTHSGTASATTMPGQRAAPCDTKTGKALTSLVIGTDDYVNLFDSLTIEVSVETGEGMAAHDDWRRPAPLSRRVTVTASRIVETPLTTPATTLYWMELANAGAAVTVDAVFNGGLEITGSFVPTNAKIEGPDGAQKETITLVNAGAVTYSNPA